MSKDPVSNAIKEISEKLLFDDNKIEEHLKKFGVSVRTADGNFRNTADVLKDLTEATRKIEDEV